jgi:hypothetical protein
MTAMLVTLALYAVSMAFAVIDAVPRRQRRRLDRPLDDGAEPVTAPVVRRA